MVSINRLSGSSSRHKNKHEFHIEWHSARYMARRKPDELFLMFLLCFTALSLTYLPVWPMYTRLHATGSSYAAKTSQEDTGCLCCFSYFALLPTKSVRLERRNSLENTTSTWNFDAKAHKLFARHRKTSLSGNCWVNTNLGEVEIMGFSVAPKLDFEILKVSRSSTHLVVRTVFTGSC